MANTSIALVLMLAAMLLLVGCRTVEPPSREAPPENLEERARQIAQRHLLVDTHIDLPYRLSMQPDDLMDADPRGDFDYPRAVEGGLDAAFMSIYIPASYQETGGARQLADSLIDAVKDLAADHPDRFDVATSPEEVRENFRRGIVSLPLGMENGAPVGRDLGNLAYFYERGIRYITLTHARDNEISDSSYDTTRTWGGLSPFGRDVVAEMNRLGLLIDVSHVSDSAFYQVLRLSRAPVVATHSSARRFTPGWERNMSDAMIRRLADAGGVIMINFGSSFLRAEYQQQSREIRRRIAEAIETRGLTPDDPEAVAYYAAQRRLNPLGTVADVADHIDHVVDLVGVDHVGLGSDFDGVFALPEGLQDAADYPNLIADLLRRGYAEEEIARILGGNFMRVWQEAERVAEDG